MAKRKRLGPPEIATQKAPRTKAWGSDAAGSANPLGVQPVRPPRRPPIAQVAGEAAAQAALEEVAGELQSARAEGRMVMQLPLDSVDETYLVRDRMEEDATEQAALLDSLRQRGQQTPIDVVDLGDGRYGLISGWRRLNALRRLYAQGQGPETVLALLRRPEDASEAYLSMVEENEIRAGLSFYERARIVARAVENSVYSSEKLALKGLFGNVSRSKRSKIGSFLKLYRALDSRLRFPSAISERLGLALVRAFDADAQMETRLRDRLRKAMPATAEEELALLERALKAAAPAGRGHDRARDEENAPDTARAADAAKKTAKTPVTETVSGQDVAPGIRLEGAPGRLVLRGRGVDEALRRDLVAWLARR